MNPVRRVLMGAVAVGVAATGIAVAQGQYAAGTTGVDVGYPNCTTTLPSTAFRIVGVSDGLGYSTSPCIKTEAAGSTLLSLYVNTGWYSGSSHVSWTSPNRCQTGDWACAAYNYGYNAGLYALGAANAADVKASTWWLDGETATTWSTSTLQNRQSLTGERDALSANGVSTIGVYSTTSQWQSITGSWNNDWPSGGATTFTSARSAQTYCTGHQFTGGLSYLMQYRSRSSTVDQDVAC